MATHGGTKTDVTASTWAVALIAFGIFDVVLTTAAVGTGVAAEAHPLIREGIQRFGLVVLPVWKGILIASFYALYRATPRPYDVGVPLGLAIVGVAVGIWNVAVVVFAIV
ncbi:hypothetical protein [Halosimplex amylolyticum]|uniref:hypothetical protein n=1 Tax=Halosimplex amylolyticum TaxID=3396616 RepID=UPI003F55A996